MTKSIIKSGEEIRDSFQIQVSSNFYPNSPSTSNLYVQLSNSIRLGENAGDWEVAITDGTLVNVTPNISPLYNNQTFTFTTGGTNYTVNFPTGNYSISAIQSAINSYLLSQGLITQSDITNGTNLPIVLSANTTIDRVQLTLVSGYTVNMNSPVTNNGIATLLGFNTSNNFTTAGTYSAENACGISIPSSLYYISCNLTNNGMYIAPGYGTNVMRVVAGGIPNYTISLQPSSGASVVYYPVQGNTISSFNVTVFDGNGMLANLAGEKTVFVFTFRRRVRS